MESQMVSEMISLAVAPAESQTILWTALPAGYIQVPGQTQKSMRILVYVSPRLSGPAGATLRAFTEFSDWPTHGGPDALKFSVQFGKQSPVPAVRTSAPPESLLWQAILPPTTPVISYQPEDHTAQELQSYPTQRIHNFIRQGFAGLAADSTTATQHPTRQGALNRFGAIAMAPTLGAPRGPIHAAAQSRFATAQRTLQQVMSQNKVVPPNVAEPALDFHRLLVFHAPRNRGILAGAGVRAARPGRVDVRNTLADFQKNLDFHKVLSFLTTYPALLLRMGLVIELAVPPQTLPANGTTIQVLPQWNPATVTRSTSPLTMCQATSTPPTFLSSPSLATPRQFQNGMVALGGGLYDLVQIDLDGAGIKMANWLQEAALAAEGQFGIPGADISTAPPTLRSAGFSVAQTGRGVWLRNYFLKVQQEEQALLQTGKLSNVLYAEDVTRGYRVDVQDVTTGGPWRSLCQRNGNYTFLNAASPQLRNWQFQDEGFVQLGVTKPTDGSQQYQVHEWLFRWNGWSLSVPRPGNTIGQDDQGRDDQVIAPNYSSQTQYGVGTQFLAAPGSLPRLRFGHAYRLRARCVDLAGNSLSLTEADDSQATPPTNYFRYEPIDAPLLALTRPLQNSPGESMARLVIRSNYQQSAQAYSTAHPGFSAVCERHIAPPITAPQMAETHGMFDNLSPDNSYALISQRQGSLGRDAASGNSMDTGNQVTIPYLPDPLARGPAFFLLPPPPAPPQQVVPLNSRTIGPPSGATPDGTPIGPIDFYSGRNTPDAWPNATSLKLRIIDGTTSPGSPSWDANARVLTIPLPQGAMWTLRLSSYPTQADLETVMGIWDWVKNIPDGSGKTTANPNAAKIEPAALMGLQWMLTPYKEITLIHAVQQPLVIPIFSQDLSATRTHGETTASVSGKCPFDGNSTEKLDILAAWDEPIDDPLRDSAPRTQHGHAHAAEIKLLPGEISNPQGPQGPLVPKPPLPPCGVEGGAFIAWIKAQRDPRDPKGIMTPQKWAQWQTDWQRQQAGQERGITFHHELHDTKRRKVSYTPVATTRFREYFPEIVVLTASGNGTTATYTFDDTAGLGPTPAVGQSITITGCKTAGFNTTANITAVSGLGTAKASFQVANGTSRVIEPEPGTARALITSLLTQTGSPQPVDLPSTARPAAPKVLYVIPIFNFQRSGSGNSQSSTRVSGLRVYMERPWYSSGDGELLGVVLWPSPPPSSPLGGSPPCQPISLLDGSDCAPAPSGGRGTGGTGGTGGTAGGGPGGGGRVHAAERPMSRQVPRMATQMGNLKLTGPISVFKPHLDVPNPLLPYVTQWGLDPIWLSAPVSDLPGMMNFKNAVATGTFLTLDELAPDSFQYYLGGPDKTQILLQCNPYDDNLRVCVVGFQPAYDPNRQLWYCDIEIDPQGSYFPFIRLALARFQPNSVSYQESRLNYGGTTQSFSSVLDLHLSRVVLSDFAQIAPNRALSVTQVSPTQLNVSLAGVAFTASAYTNAGVNIANISKPGTQVEISIETQQSASSDDMGWTPVPNTNQILRPQPGPPNAVWRGNITLPGPRASHPYRLVIREYELFISDSGTQQPARRLVYADAVKL